eukprot:1434586-Pleurochrysis_carterae.AAC.3
MVLVDINCALLVPARSCALIVGAKLYPLTIMRLKLTVAATTVARKVSVVCGKEALKITTRPATSRAHDFYTMKRKAESF